MRNKIIAVLILIIIAWLTYERAIPAIFKSNQELWLEVAEASKEDFDSIKVKFLLWNGADPLFELKGTDTTVYAMAFHIKNEELLGLLSMKVNPDDKERYYQRFKHLYEGEDINLREILVIQESVKK
ncbi:hypothetical protein [Kangiella sp.]|uniref:hypothetical protein n=1 Tax=Kangiella sp. TaxID=1920245 RepID=UPI0019BDFC3A|nr:hypothetical protein [Kangiella sp.]MBD3653474.1 hypothetical protein [Kangiella sp.]